MGRRGSSRRPSSREGRSPPPTPWISSTPRHCGFDPSCAGWRRRPRVRMLGEVSLHGDGSLSPFTISTRHPEATVGFAHPPGGSRRSPGDDPGDRPRGSPRLGRRRHSRARDRLRTPPHRRQSGYARTARAGSFPTSPSTAPISRCWGSSPGPAGSAARTGWDRSSWHRPCSWTWRWATPSSTSESSGWEAGRMSHRSPTSSGPTRHGSRDGSTTRRRGCTSTATTARP